MSTSNVVPIEAISQKIFIIRGVKVMLDYDLATWYGVLTKNLNLAVRRNQGRFPNDFMFQLTRLEFENLRLQIATSSLEAGESMNRLQIETGSEDDSNQFQVGTGSKKAKNPSQIAIGSKKIPNLLQIARGSSKASNLILQSAISSWGGRRQLPYAFTEHGVAMLSSVLHSPRAVQINIFIVRAFIKLRELLASNKELANKVEWIEKEQRLQNQHINAIYRTLDGFLKAPVQPKEPIKPKEPLGFRKG